MTSVRVNTTTHAATHVATNMLRTMRQIIRAAGLDVAKLRDSWTVIESGVSTWLQSGHLRALVLEVWDPTRPGSPLVGRFDFTINYSYGAEDDGDFWLDSDVVSYAVRKNGSIPARCEYRFVADTANGRPNVAGWCNTSFRSTAGFTKNTIGTALGAGNLGADLAYYTRSTAC